jgi:hypothetical protein
MAHLVLFTQLVVAGSVYFVWTFRFFNVVKEFNQFGLSDTTRSFVGAAKCSLAALLIVGIWHVELIAFSSAFMGFFMIGAQYFHFKANNQLIKRLPSLLLLLLCAFLLVTSLESIK